MNLGFPAVETSLSRVESRWKWLRFLQRSFVLGALLSLAVLALGIAILEGWLASKALAVTIFALLATVGFVAWAVIIFSVLAAGLDRSWVASAIERVDGRLLDRLNTLLFLQGRAADAKTESFTVRIGKQTDGILAEQRPRSPFRATRPVPQFLAFAAMLACALFFYQHFSPWRLLAAQQAKAAPPRTESPLELAPPASNNVEQAQYWGEVRITDPGGDLKVTKVDVVPLQIEAAANQPLTSVRWVSAINGSDETAHELPPPSEPRYAVYQPTIYLDEMKLSDWDVLTYYAKAETAPQNSMASDVYFLEVRPFREDILKMPGGEGGSAYQSLSEISGLISRQQHVIRQTCQHAQKPPEHSSQQEQDRMKLSGAENDLSDSTRHLYAKLAAEMENKPIGEALDSLAKAEKSLAGAGKLLEDNVMAEAQNRERGALAELVAARKMFQKAVSDNPSAFQEPNEDEAASAARTSKVLNEMAEFRDEAKAAQDVVRKTLEQQRALDNQTRSSTPADYSRLAEKERRLTQSLSDFQAQHPQAFKKTEQESREAQQAMSGAADALQNGSRDAGDSTRQAGRQLERLSDAMNSQSASQQLADAYRLKQMVDKQVQSLDQRAQPDSKTSDADARQTARQARETLNQLKRTAEQDPTRDAFGQPLRDALNGGKKVDLDAKLLQVERPGSLDPDPDEAAKRQRAADARDALAKVSKAFEASQPKSLQTAQQTDALKPAGTDSFQAGMAELDSLIKQMENDHPLSREDLARQGRQALYNLQTGMRSRQGGNDGGNQIMSHLQQMLEAPAALDVDEVKKLMEELRQFSAESADQLAKKADQPDVTNIDPSRLPPAYRGRIQKYFEKLSER